LDEKAKYIFRDKLFFNVKIKLFSYGILIRAVRVNSTEVFEEPVFSILILLVKLRQIGVPTFRHMVAKYRSWKQ